MIRGLLLLLAVGLFGCSTRNANDARPAAWPDRVLVTNDNGIDDPGIVELARALSRDGIEVVVVAARQDRSGTSNYMSETAKGAYRVERRDLGAGIEAYALDGYPADCVIFGLSGPMHDSPPDLVISGINGGPNLADEWLGSGTVGAARTAAYFGAPAIAVSGLDDGDPAAVTAATGWVTAFVRSPMVRAIRAPEYLTVSIPGGAKGDVKGARLVTRARGLSSGQSVRSGEGESDEEIWSLDVDVDPTRAGAGTDVDAYKDGYIAIVPMRADEAAPNLMRRLARLASALPSWKAATRP